MKLILCGFLRRWWIWYSGGLLVATAVNLAHDVLPLPWVPYLLAPWLGGLLVMLDLISGVAGLTLTLPISTKVAARAYWVGGVIMPSVILVIAQCIAAMLAMLFGWRSQPAGGHLDVPFGISTALGCQSLGLNLVISLALSSFSVFACTFLPMSSSRQSGNELSVRVWNVLSAVGIMILFNASMFSGCGMPMILDSVQRSPVAIVSLGALVFVFIVLGYARMEGMLLRWARMRPPTRGASHSGSHYQPQLNFFRAGLPSLFFDTFGATLLMSFSVLLMGLCFKILRNNWIFIHYSLFFCTILAAMRFMQSLRPLRALPISTNKLAVILFLLPMANATLYLGVVAIASLLGMEFQPTAASWTSVLLNAGLASLSSAFCLRFGVKALVLVVFIGIWFLVVFILMVERLHLSSIAFWGPGLSLMALSFSLLRRWIGKSQTYRYRGEPAASV
ncbi:MAG TPA: hypothetical protein VMZ27_06105 [Candidatus Saccharimonadales bacterium]|nr:hypothetical protein [Candidatus Saccharimonadales bacterium]